ncbi:MAG: GxxExxY protein [Thiohalospira sp.]
MVYLHQDITERIIKAYYKVYNTLGYGFLERVYQKAMLIELRNIGLHCNEEYPVKVYYQNILVGDYRADIIVEDKVIIENKASDALCEEHEYQLINYLKATEIEIGLLLNFGKKPEFKRKIFINENNEMNTDGRR